VADADAVKDEIRDIVRQLNHAWLAGRSEDLARWLHEEVVIAPPGFGGQVRGRQAAAATYVEFAKAATLHVAAIDPADVQVWGDVAVATCRFELQYTMGGERIKDLGWDVLVFRRAAQVSWQVLWRTVIPAAP
jgi:hypothetical protein